MITPKTSVREKTIRQIAFDLKQFRGELELTLSAPNGLPIPSIIGIINDVLYQYFPKRFENNEFPELMEVLEAAKREGYFPSQINRVLMFLGYAPKRMRLKKLKNPTTNFSRFAYDCRGKAE